MPKRLVILDGYSLLYRAFFATRYMSTSDGRPTNALYGFIGMLFYILEHDEPDAMVVALDAPGKTFRHAEYSEYKGTRRETADELIVQLKESRELIAALGIPSIEATGFEADDVVGTISRLGEENGYNTTIVTGDLDSLQLVDPCVQVMTSKIGVTDVKFYKPEDVVERYGFEPKFIPDYKAIVGDSSDNIPGVPGIGAKGAADLIQKWGTIENMLEHYEEIEPKYQKKIEPVKEQMVKSKWLATINCDAPVQYDFKPFRLTQEQYEAAQAFFDLYELRSHARRMPLVLGKYLHGFEARQQKPTEVKNETLEVALQDCSSLEELTAWVGDQEYAVFFDTAATEDIQKPQPEPQKGGSDGDLFALPEVENRPATKKLAYVAIEKEVRKASEEHGLALLAQKLNQTILHDSKPVLKRLLVQGAGGSQQGTGFRVQGSASIERIGDSGSGIVADEGLGYRVQGSGIEDRGSRIEDRADEGSGFRVQGSASIERIGDSGSGIVADEGSGFRVQGSASRASEDTRHKTQDIPSQDLTLKAQDSSPQDTRHKTQDIRFDSMLAGYVLQSGRSNYALRDLVQGYLEITPPTNGAEMAAALWHLQKTMRDRLEKETQTKVLDQIEQPLVPVLGAMELAGIRVDPSVLGLFSLELEKEVIRTAECVFLAAGQNFNIGSPKQLGDILFEKLGIPGPKKTKTGYATGAEVLQLLAPTHPICADVLSWRELSKLKSTYADALPKLIAKDGRIHTTFAQTVAATGRLSSNEPNLQNIPIRTELGRNIRRAFVAEKGFKLASFDYSQIELRILAHMCGDENLIDAFNNGVDIHRATAALMYNMPVEEVQKEQRNYSKTLNFAVLYGVTEYGLANQLGGGFSVAEAKALIEQYRERFPKVKAFTDSVIAEARAKGFTTTLMGRRRYFPDIHNANRNERMYAERQAMNAPIQGTASDMIKLAMIRVQQRLLGFNSDESRITNHDSPQPEPFRTRLLLQVHDELLFELAEGEEHLLEAIREDMETALELSVPIEVDLKIGCNWDDMTPLKRAELQTV